MAPPPFTVAEIEELLLLVAEAVERCGDHLLPMFEMLEGELERAKRLDSPRNRARLIARMGAMEV